MSEARDEYLKAMYALSKSDPSAWATFIETFKVYTAYELERMLTSPSAEAQVSLGMGRRMKELRDDFVGIEGIMDKYRKQEKQHKPIHGTI